MIEKEFTELLQDLIIWRGSEDLMSEVRQSRGKGDAIRCTALRQSVNMAIGFEMDKNWQKQITSNTLTIPATIEEHP